MPLLEGGSCAYARNPNAGRGGPVRGQGLHGYLVDVTPVVQKKLKLYNNCRDMIHDPPWRSSSLEVTICFSLKGAVLQDRLFVGLFRHAKAATDRPFATAS